MRQEVQRQFVAPQKSPLYEASECVDAQIECLPKLDPNGGWGSGSVSALAVSQHAPLDQSGRKG